MNNAAATRDEDEDQGREIADASAIGALNRSDVEAQLAAAHRYPRSVKKFLRSAEELVTLTTDVAESCIYSVERAGDMLSGPSVRLAEIAASAWGNMQMGARVVAVDETSISCQGVAWDMEANLRVAIEVRRRITKKNGTRYNEDGITNAGNAGNSIALRNAIFRIIPGAYIQRLFERAKAVAVGDAKTLAKRRVEIVERLGKLGVTPDRIYARLGRAGIVEVGLEDVAILIGLGTAIKNGERTSDEAFPPVGAGVVTQSAADLEKRIHETPAAPAPVAAAPTTPAPAPVEAQLAGTATNDAEAPAAPSVVDQVVARATVEGNVVVATARPANEHEHRDPWGLVGSYEDEALQLRTAILEDAAKPSKAAEKALRLRFDTFNRMAPPALAAEVQRFHALVQGRKRAGQPLPPVDLALDEPDDGPPPPDHKETT